MIQRIQSVYLLLVAILMGITAFSPLFVFGGSTGYFDFLSYGIIAQSADSIVVKPTYGVVTMAGLSALLAFVNIFLYKKRKVQIRVGYLTSLLIVLFYVTLATYFYFIGNKYGEDLSGIYYGIVLPIIALIINMLAVYKVKKDEKLVRSLDRIR